MFNNVNFRSRYEKSFWKSFLNPCCEQYFLTSLVCLIELCSILHGSVQLRHKSDSAWRAGPSLGPIWRFRNIGQSIRYQFIVHWSKSSVIALFVLHEILFVFESTNLLNTHWHMSTVVYKWWHLADCKLFQFIKHQKNYLENKRAGVTNFFAEKQQMVLVVCHYV